MIVTISLRTLLTNKKKMDSVSLKIFTCLFFFALRISFRETTIITLLIFFTQNSNMKLMLDKYIKTQQSFFCDFQVDGILVTKTT